MVYNEKEKVASKIDSVAEILPGKENVRIKSRSQNHKIEYPVTLVALMASSPKSRGDARKQRSNSFRTIVYPGEIGLLFCITEPIEVILIYLYQENGFKLRYIKQKDATEVYSGVESKDIIEISSPKSDDDLDIRNVDCEPTADTYILHKYDDDHVFGWSLKVSEAYASQRKDQVLHVLPRTAMCVLRGKKSIIIKTHHMLDGTNCNIKNYTKKKGRKYMYLTKGWYEFRRANQLKLGDKLEFQLSYPLKVLVVDIVCSNG
ncbi:hypothetical protein P8452_23988 [Trifolium repens]|nr:hypothetical protein P8452_23988 [Trifolium repens]